MAEEQPLLTPALASQPFHRLSALLLRDAGFQGVEANALAQLELSVQNYLSKLYQESLTLAQLSAGRATPQGGDLFAVMAQNERKGEEALLRKLKVVVDGNRRGGLVEEGVKRRKLRSIKISRNPLPPSPPPLPTLSLSSVAPSTTVIPFLPPVRNASFPSYTREEKKAIRRAEKVAADRAAKLAAEKAPAMLVGATRTGLTKVNLSLRVGTPTGPMTPGGFRTPGGQRSGYAAGGGDYFGQQQQQQQGSSSSWQMPPPPIPALAGPASPTTYSEFTDLSARGEKEKEKEKERERDPPRTLKSAEEVERERKWDEETRGRTEMYDWGLKGVVLPELPGRHTFVRTWEVEEEQQQEQRQPAQVEEPTEPPKKKLKRDHSLALKPDPYPSSPLSSSFGLIPPPSPAPGPPTASAATGSLFPARTAIFTAKRPKQVHRVDKLNSSSLAYLEGTMGGEGKREFAVVNWRGGEGLGGVGDGGKAVGGGGGKRKWRVG